MPGIFVDRHRVKLRVGLTGGIGSGKSEVGKIFTRLGAVVIDADQLARSAVAPGSPGYDRIARRWPHVIAADGELDRPALAAVVFSDAAAREELNLIVHPVVRVLGAAIEAAAGPEQIVVHDVPLLFEAGFYRACDANVLVVADKETRIERIIARSNMDVGEIERRMAAQIEPQRAVELADYTIDNDGTLAALDDAVSEVYADLLERIPTISRGTKRAGES
jgi:dephospho-CoA kinase